MVMINLKKNKYSYNILTDFSLHSKFLHIPIFEEYSYNED